MAMHISPGDSRRLPAGLEALLSGPPAGVSIVEIVGERWTGKTILLNRLATVAAEMGWTVAAGHADSEPPHPPFDVFVDALDDLLAGCDLDALRDRLQDHAQWLPGIFPGLAGRAPSPPPPGPAGLYQQFRAVRTLLESLSEPDGVLVAVDDVHWAGDASISLLSHLLRHPPAGKVLLAVSYRPRQVDRTLLRLLDEARADGRAHRFSPAELSADEAAAVLPADLSRVQCAALVAESGRNPGLLKAFAALRTLPVRSDGGIQPLPLDVLTSGLREFRALSSVGWLVVRSAAVLNEPFETDALKRVAGVTDTELWSALDELDGEDLIYRERLTRRLRFRNPLLRAVAYQSAGSGWLVGAHARAAAALPRQSGTAVDIARHLVHSAVSGDEASAGALLRAARDQLWNDPAQAALWARTAIDLQNRPVASPPDRLLYGLALALAGRLHESRPVLDGLRSPDSCDVWTWAMAVRWRAWVWRALGEREAAAKELACAAETLPSAGTAAARLIAYARVAHALETDTPLEDLEAAWQTETGGDPACGCREGHVLLARAALRSGTPERALAHAETAARLLDAEPDDVLVEHLEMLSWLAAVEQALDQRAAAVAHYERCLRIAEQHRLTAMVPQFAMALAAIELRTGDLVGATRHAACAEVAAFATDGQHLRSAAVRLRAEVARAAEGVPPGDEHPAPGTGGAELDPTQVDTGRVELESLSRRELDVAVLVSVGRTNQQIARRLKLSHKTVETHLGRIFRKLAVSSRAEVAATVGRSDGYRQAFGFDRTLKDEEDPKAC